MADTLGGFIEAKRKNYAAFLEDLTRRYPALAEAHPELAEDVKNMQAASVRTFLAPFYKLLPIEPEEAVYKFIDATGLRIPWENVVEEPDKDKLLQYTGLFLKLAKDVFEDDPPPPAPPS